MNIFKIIFNGSIFVSSSIIGFIYGRTFSKRAENILDLEYCIRILETEVLIGNTNLPEALDNVYIKGQGDISQMFLDIKEDLLNNNREDIYDSFLSVENKLENDYLLKKEEIEIILFLGKILGKTNRLDQEKNFKFIKEQIRELSMNASLESGRNEKLYRSLGILAGIGIIIILI